MCREPPYEEGRDYSGAEDDAERRKGEVAASRNPCEPGLDGLDLGFDDRKVGADLIGMAQGKAGRGVIGHAAMFAEYG